MNKRGSVFVLSIWVLVFLTILNGALYEMVSSQLRVSSRLRGYLVSPYLAKAVYYYVWGERRNDETSYDTLYELGQKQEKELGSGRSVYSVIDEGSKININKASQEILLRLPGFNQELAASILDSELRPFLVTEQLLLVSDVDETVFSQFKDIITIYGNGKININTASPEVFAVLGMDSDLTGNIIRYRQGDDMEEGTEDDQIFESASAILDDLRSFAGLFQEHETLLSQLIAQGMLDVSSSALSLQIETEFLNKPLAQYTIVMENESIREWREIERKEF